MVVGHSLSSRWRGQGQWGIGTSSATGKEGPWRRRSGGWHGWDDSLETCLPGASPLHTNDLSVLPFLHHCCLQITFPPLLLSFSGSKVCADHNSAHLPVTRHAPRCYPGKITLFFRLPKSPTDWQEMHHCTESVNFGRRNGDTCACQRWHVGLVLKMPCVWTEVPLHCMMSATNGVLLPSALVFINSETHCQVCGVGMQDPSTTLAVFFEVGSAKDKAASPQQFYLQFITRYLHEDGSARTRVTTISRR